MACRDCRRKGGKPVIREYRPKGDWQRHHPTAKRIASDLSRFPALAALRPRRLVADICDRYQVGETTAKVALREFRNLAGDRRAA